MMQGMAGPEGRPFNPMEMLQNMGIRLPADLAA
jgi:hypothetical protein